MGIFDIFSRFKLINRDDYLNTQKQLNNFKTIASSERPNIFAVDNYYRDTQGYRAFGFGYVSQADLFNISLYSDILRNVFFSLKTEIFRNGFDIVPIDKDSEDEHNDIITKWVKCANDNNQTMMEVLQEFENDLNVCDDAYLLCLKDYLVNSNNIIIGSEVREFIRVHPLTVKMMIDKADRLGHDEKGEQIFVSPYDRSTIVYSEFDKQTGLANIRADYRVDCGGTYMYYSRDEMLHVSKFNPTKTYGHSPLFSLYNKTLALMAQDWYIKRYYGENKPIKGLVLFNVKNKTSFAVEWAKMRERQKQEPHLVHPMIVEGNDGQDPAQYIDFMNTLQEMQYTETRNEFRQQIGAVYNVSPVFMNDTSTSGGLNNEGLQITVTNRGVEFGQAIYNLKVLPWIFSFNLGIKTFEVTLNKSEEQDEVAEEDLFNKQLQNAKLASELGLKVSFKDNKFIIDEGNVEVKDTSPSFIPFPQAKGLKKAMTPTPTASRQYLSELDKELNEVIKQIDFSKVPTKKQLDDLIDKLSKKFGKKLKSRANNIIKEIYRKSAVAISQELGVEFKFGEPDKNAITLLRDDEAYQQAFSNVSTNMSERVKQVITEAYENPKDLTISKITAALKDATEKSTAELKNIARTETSKISSAARLVSYSKSPEFKTYKFRHIGPEDNRTTELSKVLKERTAKGVSWDEYVNIMKEESIKYFPQWTVNPFAPVSHYQSRHTFVRIIGE